MKTINRYFLALLMILLGASMAIAQEQQDSILEITLDAKNANSVHLVFPDSLNIADVLGINEPFIIVDKKYLKITREPKCQKGQNVSISYPKIWDEIDDINDQTKTKITSTFTGYTICEIQELPTLGKLTDTKIGKNLAFYSSKPTIVPEDASDWTITYFHTESEKIGLQQKQADLSSDTLSLFANDSIVKISLKSCKYSIIDSVFIDSIGISVSNKDNFLEEKNLNVKVEKRLSAGTHNLAYTEKTIEGGALVYGKRNVMSFEVKEAPTDNNIGWILLVITIIILLAAGGFFGWKYYSTSKKTQQTKAEIEKKISEKLNNDGIDNETKKRLNTLRDQAKTNQGKGLEEILKQVEEIKIEPKEEPEPDGSTDIPVPESNSKVEKNKISRRSVLEEFIKMMKAEGTDEPDPDIRKLLKELKEQLRQNGKAEGQKETIKMITNRPALNRPSLKGQIQTPTDLAMYLENLLAITKEEAKDQPQIDALTEKLQKKEGTITELKEQISSLNEDKKGLEDKLKSAQEDLSLAQQKNNDLSSQVDALQNRVVDINSLEDAQKQIIIEEARDSVKAEYEQQLGDKQSEIDKFSGQANAYKEMMEKVQEALSKEQEKHREDLSAAEKDKIIAIQDTRNKLEQAKEEACAQIRTELEMAQTALAEAEENHREAIQSQKEQHHASKLKWEDDKKKLEDTIASEKQGRIADREQAEKDKTEAVNQAILETERTAQEILNQEIAAHQQDNKRAHAEMEQAKKDAATALAQMREMMQSRIDSANQETQDAIDVRQSERQVFAYEMQQHIVRMYQQLSAAFANAVANYQTEGSYLVSNVEQMYDWYQANIVAPFQSEESLSLPLMVETMQQECVRQLTDRYSVASRLIRLVSYSQISTVWVEWMTRQGVDLRSIRIAYGELTSLLGRCKVTLITPSLFIDLYDHKTCELDMSFSPIQNYCPEAFDCLSQTTNAVVRDLSTPGYLIDGNLKAMPVVMAQ